MPNKFSKQSLKVTSAALLFFIFYNQTVLAQEHVFESPNQIRNIHTTAHCLLFVNIVFQQKKLTFHCKSIIDTISYFENSLHPFINSNSPGWKKTYINLDKEPDLLVNAMNWNNEPIQFCIIYEESDYKVYFINQYLHTFPEYFTQYITRTEDTGLFDYYRAKECTGNKEKNNVQVENKKVKIIDGIGFVDIPQKPLLSNTNTLKSMTLSGIIYQTYPYKIHIDFDSEKFKVLVNSKLYSKGKLDLAVKSRVLAIVNYCDREYTECDISISHDTFTQYQLNFTNDSFTLIDKNNQARLSFLLLRNEILTAMNLK